MRASRCLYSNGLAGWRLRAVLIFFCLCGALASGQSRRVPEYNRREERYWEELHAKEKQEALAAERWEYEHREEVKAALPHILEEGDALQSSFIQLEDGHLYPPATPSIFQRYPDQFRIAAACALLLGLGAIMSSRHREAAKVRALCAGYLSDGVEVAKCHLPEWFTSLVAEPGKAFTNDANSSNVDVSPPAAVEFFAKASDRLAKVRAVLKETGSLEATEARPQAFKKVHELICELRDSATNWELRPAWQMSSALEVLLQRLVERPKDATPSVMRTIAGAMDVLSEVCVPGVRPNLLIDPPIKILAVDDLELCRRALKYALEKANLTPDLAESGEKAVEMANLHTYDVVFMDIQMPGIDGLTACTQIHDTKKNADVPVIFVTVQSDFQTRAQVRLKGGADVMAKPYLVFELTLKAVTFAMRKRLQMAESNVRYYAPETTPAPILLLPSSGARELAPQPLSLSILDSNKRGESAVTLPKLDGDFFVDMPQCLATMRETLKTLCAVEAPESRAVHLGMLHALAQALAAKARLRELTVTGNIAKALDALIKKLHQAPKLLSESTLNTISYSLDLLEHVCCLGVEQKLADHSPVQILVVEDEPLSRRAVVGALQLAFEKPTSAEDGVEALARAVDKHFDVIFTDVEMPRMDGYELCTRLRAEGVNRDTPIVFITRHADTAARTQASQSGGTDFISKPFLPIEIAVKALTFAWESRYRKLAGELAGGESPETINRIETTTAALSEKPLARQQANVQPCEIPTAAPH
jgi:CheY-like chemotaxis protein